MTGAVLNTQGFGNRPENLEIPFFIRRSPASTDVDWPVGKRWISTASNKEFVMTSKNSYLGVLNAVWVPLAGGGLTISSVGTATLVSGSVTVMDATCLTSSSVFVSRLTSINSNDISVVSIEDGSFGIQAFSGSDGSTVAYMIVN